MATETAQIWTDKQKQYIKFLSSNKTDTAGKRYTRGEFSKIIGVNERTLYDWQNLPGFKEAVFEQSLGRQVEFLPVLIKAQIDKASKKGDTQAFMALMRQWALLKSDKMDHTTNGKDIPAPILGGETTTTT